MAVAWTTDKIPRTYGLQPPPPIRPEGTDLTPVEAPEPRHERTEAFWATLSRWRKNPRARGVGYGLAVVLFAGGIAVAWSGAGVSAQEIDPLPALLVAFGGVPLQVLFGGLLLRELSRSGGNPPPLPRVCRIVGLGTLSSVLPMASGTVVRGAAMVYWGMPSVRMIRIMALDALLWVAAGLFLSGVALMASGVPGYGYAALAAAAATGVPSFVAATSTVQGRAVGWALWRLGGVAVDVLRLWGCLAALGHGVDYVDAAVLGAASPLSSLFFFLPGGLGVRELVTAGLAQAATIDPAVAFLAASLNRILGLLVLGLLELLMAGRAAAGLIPGGNEAPVEGPDESTSSP